MNTCDNEQKVSNMKNNKKGFTLAELLIVVAIIGVLVAVSIPIFTDQLRKARFATNKANARAAYAAAVAAYISEDIEEETGVFVPGGLYNVGEGSFTPGLTSNICDFSVFTSNSGQLASWSANDDDLDALCTTIYKDHIQVIMDDDGTVTEYRFSE